MTVSHINENVILEEVMSTHNPDGKEDFKINIIFDSVKRILCPTTIGEDSIDEDDEDSDKEDFNGEESDDEDSNGHKFNKEKCDDKMSDDEREFDREEEYSKDMELPYQFKRFSFEMSLMCSKNMDLHSLVIYFLKMLSTFSWEGKLLIMLSAFSLNFGEFSLVHSHNKGLELPGKLAILKGRESQIRSMVTHFIKPILHMTEYIIELAQSSSHNSSPIIPIGCYWIVTGILTYASYFTSDLMSMHSGCFIGGETQLSSLTVKIKDVISDCHPILEKKRELREVDSYNALCHAFFDENPIPSTSSNLDVLKLVFNVKKCGKQKLIYDGARKEKVELRFLKNRSLLLLISSSLDIDKYLILMLEFIQEKTKLHVLWIPVLDSSTLQGIKHMEDQYQSLLGYKSELLSVRNVQKSVAPGFVRFVKEKFFPTFQIGGEPIIVSLDHNGRMVHRNAMHMVLMRAIDICERMSSGIKIGESIIPLLQKVLMERVSTVRDLVPGIDRKIDEVANKVDDIINDWLFDIENQIQNPVDNNIYTSDWEKDLWMIETWCTKLVANLGNYKLSEWIG